MKWDNDARIALANSLAPWSQGVTCASGLRRRIDKFTQAYGLTDTRVRPVAFATIWEAFS